MIDWVWLNQNAGAIQAVSTLVLVAITAYYARQTRHQVRQAERQTLESQRPVVVAANAAQIVRYAKDLVIKWSNDPRYVSVTNIGAGPALNLAVRVDLPDAPDIGWGLTDHQTAAPDLGVGDSAYVIQWSDTEGFIVGPGAVMTILYDDVYGRPFQTTYMRTPQGWLDGRTTPVNKRQPRFALGANMGFSTTPSRFERLVNRLPYALRRKINSS